MPLMRRHTKLRFKTINLNNKLKLEGGQRIYILQMKKGIDRDLELLRKQTELHLIFMYGPLLDIDMKKGKYPKPKHQHLHF